MGSALTDLTVGDDVSSFTGVTFGAHRLRCRRERTGGWGSRPGRLVDERDLMVLEPVGNLLGADPAE